MRGAPDSLSFGKLPPCSEQALTSSILRQGIRYLGDQTHACLQKAPESEDSKYHVDPESEWPAGYRLTKTLRGLTVGFIEGKREHQVVFDRKGSFQAPCFSGDALLEKAFLRNLHKSLSCSQDIFARRLATFEIFLEGKPSQTTTGWQGGTVPVHYSMTVERTAGDGYTMTVLENRGREYNPDYSDLHVREGPLHDPLPPKKMKSTYTSTFDSRGFRTSRSWSVKGEDGQWRIPSYNHNCDETGQHINLLRRSSPFLLIEPKVLSSSDAISLFTEVLGEDDAARIGHFRIYRNRGHHPYQITFCPNGQYREHFGFDESGLIISATREQKTSTTDRWHTVPWYHYMDIHLFRLQGLQRTLDSRSLPNRDLPTESSEWFSFPGRLGRREL